jgi:hypothetical protein
LESPEILHVNAPVVVQAPLGVPMTEYPVTAEPPFVLGALQDKVTWPSPTSGALKVGLPGVVTGVDKIGELAELSPAGFVATTPTEYSVPLVNPTMVHATVGGATSH